MCTFELVSKLINYEKLREMSEAKQSEAQQQQQPRKRGCAVHEVDSMHFLDEFN